MLASGSNKAITVRWLASFGATGYDLLRSTTSGSGYTVIASDLTAAKSSYVDTTAVTGTTYYYVARAKNSAGTSGNSPEFGAALLPAPRVNLAFGGTATASINTGPQVGGSDDAFNGDPGSKWFGYNAPTGWLQYDFGAGNAQVVKRYTVNSADVATRDPKNWNFLGSQDGSNWTTLDSQSDQSFILRMQQNTYDIGNTTAYRYYRIDITANNGATGVAIGDLGLWGNSGRTLRDDTYTLVNRNSRKVVDVTSAANSAQAVQQGFEGDDTQQWNLVWQGNGLYRATNVFSTKVLDNGGSSTSGADLIIQPYSGANSQLWTIVPDGDGFFRIVSANSGLVADVSGGSTANGANVVQGAYSGSDSQQWMPGTALAAQPIPPVPSGLTATAVTISTINLSWTASPGAAGYEIKRATASGGPYTTIASGHNVTNYSDTFLTSSTTYYYVVSAANGSGYSANSPQAQATTLTGAPLAPTGLTAKLGTNRVILNWTATAGAISYTVKRATASGGPYTALASGVTSPTYTDRSRNSNVACYYVIVAANADGSSPNSVEFAVGAGNLGVHLKFDETGGATAADSSGFGHNATLVNSPTFGTGTFGNALNLPATSSQHAKLTSGITSGLTDFTVSTWVNIDTFATWQRIFDFGSGTNNYMYVTTQYTTTAPNAAKLRFNIRTPSVNEQTVTGTGIALSAGVWTHVAVTRSGNTVSLYVNGSLSGSGTITLNPSDLGVTTLNYLGKSQWPNDPYLDGALDDFRIYTNALSAAEVNALAHPAPGAPTQLAGAGHNAKVVLTWAPNATTAYTVKRSTTTGGPYTTVATGIMDLTYTDTGLTNGVTYYYVVSGSNAQGSGPDSAEVAVVPSDLIAHLKFHQSAGVTATDSGSNGWNGTLVNGPLWTSGRAGNAVDLDGADDHVTIPTGVMVGVTNFTIATWVYQDSTSNWRRIFDFGTGATRSMFLTPQNGGNGRVRFAITTSGGGGEQQITGTAALPVGAWTHVAVTLAGSVGILYVNGVEVARNSGMTLNPDLLGSTNLNYIGESQYNDPYLDGRVDDFRIYARALVPAEVSALATGSAPAAPSQLTATPDDDQVHLSWPAVSGASSYTVKRATSSGGPYATIASGVTSTSRTDSGLTNGTTYYYVVTASNIVGEGAASPQAAATPFPSTFTGTAADDDYYLRRSGDSLLIWVNGDGTGQPAYTIPLAALTSLEFNGMGGDDAVTLDATGGNPLPSGGINFDGGEGTDAVHVLGSASAESFNFHASGLELAGNAFIQANVESRSFDGRGGGDAVTIAGGGVELAASQTIGSLSIFPGATLDIGEHELAVDYSSVSPVGIWTGSAYDGLSGAIKDGRLVSSLASGTLKTPGTAEAADALGLVGSQTAAWSGQAVDATAVLVKLTWGGDANLDGKINIDDYGQIDFNVGSSGSVFGYFNGDFNFDGKINIDDYGIIDFNVVQQGAPL